MSFASTPRRRLIATLPLLAAVLLAGCASVPPTPVAPADLGLPRRVHVALQSPDQPRQDALLVVQAEGAGATRWSMFDPLGMPMARQILQDGKWRNDGFMRPNGQASDMFSAILFAWTPAASLPSAYAGQDWHQGATAGGGRERVMNDDCNPRWRVVWQAGAPADTFTITTGGGTTWRVEPLKEAP
ncbi:hypothetical protein BAU08_10245 [Bordetella bronchialis]|uniref:Lipoprotein n=2 Tax=Bordetella bronchialis TaxID=463025 RepID=A0A193G5G5_9BORD|nr:hypothetical protein BAU06_10045 [Bordetella bronchialis]ANN74701.1 hypothetical protein BAU08_10245 [Bordetella bronchialis]